jgi:hypothetical protein
MIHVGKKERSTTEGATVQVPLMTGLKKWYVGYVHTGSAPEASFLKLA